MLGLPYRVVDVCGGDLGLPQARKFDIETWMPSRGSYGETHSASKFFDFQARRLMIRYRDEQGKVHFAHTLNNTVAASPRLLIPILEIYQTREGCVKVPEVLLSGNHAEIDNWRRKQALERTRDRRADLLDNEPQRTE